MGYKYFNIISEEVNYSYTLLGLNSLVDEEVRSMSVCNTHATDSVDIDLYYYRYEDNGAEVNNWDDPGGTAYTYYLLKSHTILTKTTLQLNDEYDIDFDNSLYSFMIAVSAADSTVDIVINTK